MELTVPEGSPVAVDGVMQPDEWGDCVIVEVREGVTLYAKHADGFLLLALATQEPVVGNVLTLAGDTLRIMHSSAALGTALYERSGDLWRRTQDFVWRCRSRSLTSSALAQRESFLEDERWMASITYMGERNHLEYQIANPSEIERLALVLLPASHPKDFFSWPADLDQDLLPGPIPAEGRAATETWPTLRLVTARE